MQNKTYFFLFFTLITVFLLCSCENQESNLPPMEASYFDLLGIQETEIESIEIMYEANATGNDTPEIQLTQVEPSDRIYQELIQVLQKVKQTYNSALDWNEIKPRYKKGNVQLRFYSGNQEYTLPVLDVYAKQTSKPHPASWVIYQDSYVYTANVEAIWNEDLYQGLALYLEKEAKPYIEETSVMKIKVPEYYGITQNANSWDYDCNYETLFSNSQYIFRGKIHSASVTEGYDVEIMESYKGEWKDGYRFVYKDGTGYNVETNEYYALVNETERCLNPESEYIFFMKQHPFSTKGEKNDDLEYVYLTDRQCGICEVIDDTVWPIFNAKPDTSWFIGQPVDEIKALSQKSQS